MTPKDDEFVKKIKTYLDHGAAEIKAGTAYKLQLARAAALVRVTDPKRARQPGLVLAGAGGGTVGGGRGARFGAGFWLGVLVAIAAVVGYQQWQAWQQQREIEETDAAILSSDLPIDAYLDRGFQNWLKHAVDE
jgi:hypothetical protein